MQRITNAALRGAFARYRHAADALELNIEGLSLQLGGPSTDMEYRVWVSGGYEAPGTTDGWIGSTKREAYETLMHLSRAFEAVTYRHSL